MSLFRALSFFLVAVFALTLGAIFVLPSPQKEFVRVTIGDAEIIAEVASTPEARQRGLAGREGLNKTSGMLFTFDRPDFWRIWMKEMSFPIDIFWIKDGAVVDLEEKVPPIPLVTYAPDVPADFVLEMESGFAQAHGIKIGDKVKISADIAGQEYFITTLRARGFNGKEFRIEKLLSRTDAYQKYQISYKSQGLRVTGVMNVPKGPTPKGGYPLLILNHGLISPEVYFTGRGSKREQDFFARRGYVTIHPDYRGHAESDLNPNLRHDFYVGYTEDVINVLEALKKLNPGLIDLNRVGMWGHSMGGGMAARVMTLVPDIKAYVLFAPISADAEDNFYELSKSELKRLEKTYGTGEKAREIYQKISPLAYFADVSAPVQLHHGTADIEVPISFSEKMFNTLKQYGKTVEFFTYPEEKHEFADAWPVAAERSWQFFDKYVKSR